MNILSKATFIFAILLVHVVDVSAAEQHRTRHTRTKLQMSFAQTDPSVVYVRQNATATTPDGQSWATAYTSLAQALVI